MRPYENMYCVNISGHPEGGVVVSDYRSVKLNESDSVKVIAYGGKVVAEKRAGDKELKTT